MFDAKLRPLIDPPLNRAGHALAKAGITANQLTACGFLVGLAAAAAILYGAFGWALMLIIANRMLDGLDGAVARVNGPTDLGGYFDIVADFAFYVAVPISFSMANPANALSASVLVGSFVLTAVSFLAFATIAAKRGVETQAHGRKSFYYSTGLAEGGETILVFAAMTIWPGYFALLAYGYAALCLLTVVQRSLLAWWQFKG